MPVTRADIELRVPLWHELFPFVILWSEKSNCTAVAKWFFFQLGRLDEALTFSPWIHDFEISVFKTGDYLARCLAAINGGAKVIKFVREPFARSYSGYLEMCRPHFGEALTHWSTPVRQQIIAHIARGLNELEYAFSFHQYLLWLAEQNQATLNLHLAKQHRAFEEKIDVEPFHVENGPAGFAGLEERFGLKDSSANRSIFESSHYHPKARIDPAASVAACYLGLPLRRGKGFSIVEPDVAHVARDAVGALVREIFNEDFNAYGYDAFPPLTGSS